MGLNYIQELYLYLHILDVHSAQVFTRTEPVENPAAGGISGWKDLPGIVCITLQVPRKALGTFTIPKPTEIGTPIGHCTVQSSSRWTIGRWQNIFSGIQISFGTISTAGTIHTNDYAVQVIEDDMRWQGESPIVVSFNTPSWFLLLEPHTAVVTFGLQSTPNTAMKFSQSLGIEMTIFETTLGNGECVHISRYPPNLTGGASVHVSSRDEDKSTTSAPDEFKITLSANVMSPEGRIGSLSGRLDMVSDRWKDCSRSGCAVENTQTAACDLAIAFTGETAQILLPFPIPVCGRKIETRIARKSSYVEVEAPLYWDVWASFPAFSSSHV